MMTTSARFAGRKELVAAAFLLAMSISHIVMVFTVMPSLRKGYQDFTIFYGAAKMIRSGKAAVLYNLSAQYTTQKEFAPNVSIRQAALPYNHPPFEALLFVPFTFVGYLPAYGIWTALNLIFLGTTVALLRNRFGDVGKISALVPVLAAAGFFPIVMGLIQGQDAILLLLITVLALVAAVDHRDAAAGAILALGLFKFHLIVPLALVVAAKRPRLLIGFVPMAAALVAISVAVVGWQGTLEYVAFILNLEQSGAGGAISAFEMPNLHGLVSDIAGIHAGGAWSTLLTAASVALFLTALVWVRKRDLSIQRTFALATVCALLIGYHTMPYDLSLLLPVALLVFVDAASGSMDMLLLCTLFLTPLYVFLGLQLNRLGWLALPILLLFWRVGRAQIVQSPSSAQAVLSTTL